MFDRELRMLFFKYFAIAEEALKTASAYCFSEAHIGEKEPYLDANNYDTSPSQIGILLSDFNTALGRNPRRKPKHKLYLEHYSRNHDEVPIWVLMKYLTLGQAFKFYCFQPESIRNEIGFFFQDRVGSKDIAQAAQACLRPHQGFQKYLRARRTFLLRKSISIARHRGDRRGK